MSASALKRSHTANPWPRVSWLRVVGRARDLDGVAMDEHHDRLFVEHVEPERQRDAGARVLPDHHRSAAELPPRPSHAPGARSACASGECTQSPGSAGGLSQSPPKASRRPRLTRRMGWFSQNIPMFGPGPVDRAEQAERAGRRRRAAAEHAQDQERLHRPESRRRIGDPLIPKECRRGGCIRSVDLPGELLRMWASAAAPIGVRSPAGRCSPFARGSSIDVWTPTWSSTDRRSVASVS